MKKWGEKTIAKVDINLEKSREKDKRFFRIDEFKRNVKRVDEFAKNCPDCNKLKIDIEESVQKIKEAVEVPGNSRRQLDRLITRLSKHMQKEHGFFPPYYYTYLYSFFGILAGLAVGFLLFKIIPEYKEVLLAGAISVFIISAHFTGTRKDNKIRRENRLM